MRPLPLPIAAALLLGVAPAARAQEAFLGVHAHGVDTPFTLETGERGADISLGYRFPRAEGLAFLGKPAPYLIASVNTRGETSFGGAGLSWKLGKGRFYARPGIGLVVHDGPDFRYDAANRSETDLGSRVLFEPEIAVGVRLNRRFSLEASWVHISHARLFNSAQNPGLDMMGLRLNAGL